MKKNLLIAAATLLAASAMAAPDQSLDTELTTFAESLAKAATNANLKIIATLDFTDLQGNPSELGRFIAEQVAVNMVMQKRSFAVMDRNNLNRILAEHKLSMDGLVDPANTKKLGQFSGVDAIILGRITPFTNSVSISASIILTETAQLVGGAKVWLPKSQNIQQLLDRSVVADTAASSGGTSDKQTAANKPQLDLAKLLQIEKNSLQVDDLFIKVESLRYAEDSSYGYVTATLVMVNTNLASGMGVAVEEKTPRSIATNSRGDEFESHGDMFGGIGSAFGTGNGVQGELTEIPPGKSIKVVAKYQLLLRGKGGNFAPYRLQFGIYRGKEVQGRFANVKNHNVLIDVDAAK